MILKGSVPQGFPCRPVLRRDSNEKPLWPLIRPLIPLRQSASCLIRRLIAAVVVGVQLAIHPPPGSRQAGHRAQARQRRRLPGGTRYHGRLRRLRSEWLGLVGIHNQMPPAFNVIKVTIVAWASTLWQKTGAQLPALVQVERIGAHDSERLSAAGDPVSPRLVAGFKRKIPLAPFPPYSASSAGQRTCWWCTVLVVRASRSTIRQQSAPAASPAASAPACAKCAAVRPSLLSAGDVAVCD